MGGPFDPDDPATAAGSTVVATFAVALRASIPIPLPEACP